MDLNPFAQADDINHKGQKQKNVNLSKYLVPFLVVLFLGLQIATLVVAALDPFSEETLNKQVVNEVSELTNVNPFETPSIAVVADANSLKTKNAIQAEVYKDVKDGDFVLGFSERVIVYRRDENKVIYDGPSPSKLLEEGQEKLISEIKQAAVSKGILQAGNTETPQLSVIADSAKVKAQDPKFYADAREKDVIAIFADSKLIVLYRPETKAVVNSGEYSTTIKVK